MKLRALKKKDFPVVFDIIDEHYSADLADVALRDLTAMFTGRGVKPHYIIAEEKGEIVGFGGYCESWADTAVCEMLWMNVREDFQGQGVGTAIAKKLIASIKKKYACVLITTTVPQFYKRLGFKKLHQIPKSAYLVMILDLK